MGPSALCCRSGLAPLLLLASCCAAALIPLSIATTPSASAAIELQAHTITAAATHTHLSSAGDDAVPLDLFIMSKCPDAIACETLLDKILAGSIGNYVTIRPNYIANIDARPTTCKHGQLECAGDSQQLCVLKYAASYAFWAFVQCQNQNVSAIGEPAWADFCLQQLDIADISVRRAKTCYSGSDAESLLRNNVHKTLQAGVRSSCTIRVNEDPKDWRDELEAPAGAKGFVDAICAAYHDKNKVWPPECQPAAATA